MRFYRNTFATRLILSAHWSTFCFCHLLVRLVCNNARPLTAQTRSDIERLYHVKRNLARNGEENNRGYGYVSLSIDKQKVRIYNETDRQ